MIVDDEDHCDGVHDKKEQHIIINQIWGVFWTRIAGPAHIDPIGFKIERLYFVTFPNYTYRPFKDNKTKGAKQTPNLNRVNNSKFWHSNLYKTDYNFAVCARLRVETEFIECLN